MREVEEKMSFNEQVQLRFEVDGMVQRAGIV